MPNWSIEVKTPPYVMISSDFSQQEPKLTAYVAQEPNLIKAFQEGKDVYATLASLAFNKPYEECLEFHPETNEYQPQGKARRNEAKTILLGITYGRSVPSIGQQLYGKDDTMTNEEKTKEAQRVYDSVLKAFPGLHKFMMQSQAYAHKYGYVETILGRRRHLPDMTLNEFEFEPMAGYINPNIDPLDLSTLEDSEVGIPEDVKKRLTEEFSKYKWYSQIWKRTKELSENESIKVINNRAKIQDATRQCVNCVDLETEILTTKGWKKYDEVNIGDEILSYDLDTNKMVLDNIVEMTVDMTEQTAHHLHTASFDSICTNNHRWVMRNFDTDQVRVFTTDHILRFHRPRYHILRIVDNDINPEGINVSSIRDYVKEFMDEDSKIDFESIFKLSFKDATDIYNYFRDNVAVKGNVSFSSEYKAGLFQAICFMAGHSCNMNRYEIVRKKTGTEVLYKVTCPKRVMYQTARIDLMKKEECTVEGVWCPTTKTGTWVARKNGRYYITGNSIIQGSAADFTKMALINVSTDPRWSECCGQILTLVHDEIVAQAPIDCYEEAAAVLKEDMEKSGDFLPFAINCDAEVTWRWYGLEAPCKYTKPESFDLGKLSEEDLKWIQYHLIETGYYLPKVPHEDGTDLIGDEAKGISGKVTDEMNKAIDDYINRYHISSEEFLDSIESKVQEGV